MAASIKDYYQTLQVDPAAEQEVIEAAYRRLARKYHPDANASQEATNRMQDINEAHLVLQDPARRAEYDSGRRTLIEQSRAGKTEAEGWGASGEAVRRAEEESRQRKQAEAYHDRGNVHSGQGDLDRAIADYDTAIFLQPDHVQAYNGRGMAYQRRGNLDRAMADYNRAIQLQPDYAETYYNRGLAYYYQRDLDHAMADWDKAVELKPDYAEAYYNRGNIYFDRGELDRAFADYDTAIQLQPGHVKTYNGRGIAYQHKGDCDRALADWSKAIELKPDYAEAYFNRGLACYYQRDLDHAVADFRKVLEVTGDPALRRKTKSMLVRTKGHRTYAPRRGEPLTATQPIPDDVRTLVWQRDGGRCVKCGSQHGLAFDYIIPIAQGGSNTARNLQLLCEKCHQEKGEYLI